MARPKRFELLTPDSWSGVIRPVRVNRVVLTVVRPLPVYPDERTSSDRPGMSGWCQIPTSLRWSGAVEAKPHCWLYFELSPVPRTPTTHRWPRSARRDRAAEEVA